MPAPDRSINVTVRYTYKVTIDEATLARLTGVEQPTATQMKLAFDKWKADQVRIAATSFRTAHALADNSDVSVEVT